MSRKSLIICLAVIAAMVVGIGVAVAVLYSGTGSSRNDSVAKVSDDSRYLLLPAVPSDVVMLCCFSDADEALDDIYGGSTFPAALKESGVRLGRMTVSLHFSGKLSALYVIDMGRASGQPSIEAETVMDAARGCGMCVEYLDCSTTGSEFSIANRSIVVASASEGLVKSSLRHIQKAVSVLEAPGFADAAEYAASETCVFIPNEVSPKILSSVFSGKYNSWSRFAPKLSDWTVLDAGKSDGMISFYGRMTTDGDLSDFITLFERSGAASSKLSSVLPSNTLSAASVPFRNVAEYISEYQMFLDARQSLQTRRSTIDQLEKKAGVSPVAFFTRIETKEAATASFLVDGKLERVNLIRAAKPDTLKNYAAGQHPYKYSSFASSVFGSLFEIPDESSFTYVDGWIISGSPKAVDMFATDKAAKYTLKEYMVNAGLEDLFSAGQASFMAYLSLTEDRGALGEIFRTPVLNTMLSLVQGSDYSGVFVSAGQPKLPHAVSMSLFHKEIKKSKPVAQREVTVTVSKGPFKVKNSGTGKMNLFYQQDNMYLCLKEEGGKGLWGVPFSEPICGKASTIDYYANGKLQILFGAGTRLHLIDRLGRFVSGFPVDLGKEILLGPDVYDFNGSRRYNVMVLHKDNTIEMYNLKGQKPASWAGIRPSETIRDLPERIIVGGNTFWVVRTSVQTLIYPFGGGQPLTSFEGEQMALPDSEVKVIDGSAVELQCYDGRSRTVKLK